MQNIPHGEEFRHVRARLSPVTEIRTTQREQNVDAEYRSSLDSLQQQTEVNLWGREVVTGPEAIWKIAIARLQLLDDEQQIRAEKYIRENIDNCKELIIATQPLVEANNQFLLEFNEYRNRQEVFRGPLNPNVNVTVGAKIEGKVEQSIIKCIEYQSPVAPDVIPVATLLSLDVVDMAKLLDMARNENGDVDAQTLEDCLFQGTKLFDQQENQPRVYENETRRVRLKMKSLLESDAFEKIEKNGNKMNHQLHRITSKMPATEVQEMIELTKAVATLAENPKIQNVLLNAEMIDRSFDMRPIKEAVQRVNEALKSTGTAAVKPRVNDVVTILEFKAKVSAIAEAKNKINNKMNRSLEEYVQFEEDHSKGKVLNIAKLMVRKIQQQIQKMDIIWWSDVSTRQQWQNVLVTVHNLVQKHYEVEQDVTALLGN